MLARDAAEESPEWRRRRRESIGKDTPRCVALFSTLDPTPTRPWALAQLRIGSGYGSGMGRPVVFYGLLATPLSMVTVAVAFISSWVEMRAPPPPQPHPALKRGNSVRDSIQRPAVWESTEIWSMKFE